MNEIKKLICRPLELFALFWRRKWLIIGITAFGMVGALVYSIISIMLPPDKSYMPNIYEPMASMLITEDSSGSSALGSLGGLASIAGVGLSTGATNSALAIYLVYSNTVMDAVVDRFGFIKKWAIRKSPRAESRMKLKNKLSCTYLEKSGVLTISFSDKDPVLARDVVNFVVDLLDKRFNELGLDKNKLQKENLEENINAAYQEILYCQTRIKELESSVSNVYSGSDVNAIMTDTSLLRMELAVQEGIYKNLKTQYESLKVTMASEKPVFQILEKAEIPDMKIGPSRGKLCIIISFVSGFFSVVLAFLLEIIKIYRLDKELLAFFKVKRDEK